jgi:hypothetical protein
MLNVPREFRSVQLGRLAPVDVWTLLVLPATAVVAWLFVVQPLVVQLLAAGVLALPLLLSPRVRVLFVLVGTLTVFGPAELTAPKLLFLFGTAVAVAGAFAHARTLASTPAYEVMNPLFKASFALFALVALSLPVALSNGVTRTDWLREAAPYVLLACAPFFAFDALTAFGVRGLRRLIALVGLAGGGAFMISWYVGRGLTSVVSDTFGLATFMLAAALFAFAVAMALDAERARLRWLALGALVFAMIATTGTRSSVVLLAAPLAILAATQRHLARRSVRLLVLLPIASLLAGLGAYTLVRVFDANQDIYEERIQLLLNPGGQSDQSYLDRRRQTEAAWGTFRAAPFAGTGPGSMISGRSSSGRPFTSPNVDSPAGFLVDFGLVGVLVLGVSVVLFASTVRRQRLLAGLRTTGQLALIGFAAIIVARSVLQVPFEDKGLAAGLLLLLAISTREGSMPDRRALGSASAQSA